MLHHIKRQTTPEYDDRWFSLDYFFWDEEDNGPKSSTLVEIENISKLTRVKLSEIFVCGETSNNVLFVEAPYSLRLLRKLRKLFRVLSKNSNIVALELNLDAVLIPGDLIAGWLQYNKYVTELKLTLPEEQSDMQLLCDALQCNKTIKTIIFEYIKTQESDLPLLGKALQENRNIVTLSFEGEEESVPLIFLQKVLRDALGPGSVIKNVILENVYCDDYILDFANQMENILSTNTSLNSLAFVNAKELERYMMPILRGVVNSVCITEFHCYSYYDVTSAERDEENDDEENHDEEENEDQQQIQHEHMEMIANMKKIKVFSFDLRDFCHLSPGYISSILKGMHSLDLLEINVCPGKECNLLKGIIQDMSTWEQQQYKLKLVCDSPNIDLFPLLKSVRLESIYFVEVKNLLLDKITEEIPSLIYLNEFIIRFKDIISQELEFKIAIAVTKNSSLKKILIKKFGSNVLSTEVQTIVDQVVERNKYLYEIQNNPERVHFTQWPELLAMANPTGLNFSYECIRKVPDLFISLFREYSKQADSSSANFKSFRGQK